MSTKITLPKWGMGMTEGTIARWLRKEGERVKQGEPLVEIETAKATQEMEAPVSGVLTKILVAEGNAADVNADIALIEEDLG